MRKKRDGNWEKTSQGEGKTIRLSLEEMISIKEIYKKCPSSWNSVHKYKGEMTSIEFVSRENPSLPYLLKIGTYPKPLTFSQGEILRRLLEHLITEKIEHLNTFIKKPAKSDEIESPQQNILYIKEETTKA
ncbi:MAG: hypothetical protein KGD73_13025 [Candidatus Lokiarchaeota archaeon]|nr:hypothetical protein [Candidatus Lokiarchaeota archaeon]